MRETPFLARAIHHTSPRSIGDVPHGCLDELEGLAFADLVLSHIAVGSLQVIDRARTNERTTR